MLYDIRIDLSYYKNPESKTVKELLEMQKLFANTEYDFLLFNEIVPYSYNPLTVYSPKLVSILQSIGPQIYGVFEIITKQFGMSSIDFKFPDYFNALDNMKLLSCQSVTLLENKLVIQPFEESKTNYDWWNAYNNVKHELPKGIFEAKYENVIYSLGALYILHHIADTIQRKKNPIIEKAEITDSTNWLSVLTKGNYIYYKSETAINSTLYETFSSRVFSINKRFLPHLKDQKIEPDYSKS